MNHEGKRIRIMNFDNWKDLSDYKNTELYIGQTGTIKQDYEFHHRFVIEFDDKNIQSIDDENGNLCFRLENIEFHNNRQVQPKPPLGVMPKEMYEHQRIQALAMALHEYIDFQDENYNLLISWAEELVERLKERKGKIKKYEIQGWEKF